MKLKCEKCKTEIETEKWIEFCICGGKYYNSEMPNFMQDILNKKDKK